MSGASSIEETAPLGGLAQAPYLNQMLRIETSLTPEALLDAVLEIERAGGRERTAAVRWDSRTIDIDVVLYGEHKLATSTLVVPHPGLASRDFWQRELAQLGVEWRTALGGVATRVRSSDAQQPAGANA